MISAPTPSPRPRSAGTRRSPAQATIGASTGASGARASDAAALAATDVCGASSNDGIDRIVVRIQFHADPNSTRALSEADLSRFAGAEVRRSRVPRRRLARLQLDEDSNQLGCTEGPAGSSSSGPFD